MRREEKKRKFNEAVINILFPSPQADDTDERSSHPQQQHVPLPNVLSDDIEDDDTVSHSRSDEEEEEEDQLGKQKLSRAQRKRIRKKKLKQESIRRGKMNMIGPLWPESACGCGGKDERGGAHAEDEEPPCVRGNVELEQVKSSHTPVVNNNKKLKQRRMAKRFARDSLNSSSREE